MEYKDETISSPEQFSLLAKEYSEKVKKLKQEQVLLLETLFSLSWIFRFIWRNVGFLKIKNVIREREKETQSQFETLFDAFNIEKSEMCFACPKRIWNLRGCIKYAIVKEAEVCELMLKVRFAFPEINEFLVQNVNSIKALTKLI